MVQYAMALAVLLAMAATPARAEARTDQLATLINRARVARGLLPLARASALDTAAQTHSADMVAHNYLDHTGSDSSTPQERAERAGYQVPRQSAWIVVEVISAISDDPAGPLDWWLNESPEVHGKVLTDPRWREMGVGYAEGGEYGHYWTVLVGCRPDVLPTLSFEGRTFEHTERCGDAGASRTALSVTSAAAAPGADLEVRWSGIASPTDRDWIGLYRVGDSDARYLAWTYVSCGTTPLAARASGWCWLHLPSTLDAGAYQLRLHANDSMEQLASSSSVTLTATTTGSTPTGAPFGPDQ